MYPNLDISIGDGLRLRALTVADVDLLVAATRDESGRALWGAHPAGPYSAADALAALQDWAGTDPAQVSYGVLDSDQLVAALGLISGGPGIAELAYWVRPDRRRRGIGLRGVVAITEWAHDRAGLDRVWLEIDPVNAASQRLATRAGFGFEERLRDHCRSWIHADPARDTRHDCLIWASQRVDRSKSSSQRLFSMPPP